MYRRNNRAYEHLQSAQTDYSKDVQSQNGNIPRGISGHNTDIYLSSAIIVTPPLAFSAVLLGLIYKYRVIHNDTTNPNLRAPDLIDDDGAYFVQFSSTMLIFIASWSSTLAPLLIGFIMNLAAYPISQQYWSDIQTNPVKLPTPYQLHLVVKFITGGGWSALYDWMAYLVGWKHQRQVQPKPLITSVTITILAVSLGVLVFLADTWLHVTASTVNFIQINPVSNVIGHNYSIGLRPGCLAYNASTHLVYSNNQLCTISRAATNTFLVDAAQSYATLSNVSSTIGVFNNGPDPMYAYLGAPLAQASTNEDFTAETFGMRTECKLVSKECNLNAYNGASTPFRCSADFNGDLTLQVGSADAWIAGYFSNASMRISEENPNPYYYGVAAKLNWVTSPLTVKASQEQQIITPMHGGIAFVLNCRISLYDIEYDSINGTVTRFVASLSNNTVAAVWRQPMEQLPNVAKPNLMVATLTTATTATTTRELTDGFALAYSKIALSIGAQSVQGRPALAIQQRDSFLVTRLPKVPLFCLIAANLSFVALGLIMMVVALKCSSHDIREVKARMNLVGLIADRFEGSRATAPVADLSDLFEEHEGITSSRVAMDRGAAGGYVYWQRWPFR